MVTEVNKHISDYEDVEGLTPVKQLGNSQFVDELPEKLKQLMAQNDKNTVSQKPKPLPRKMKLPAEPTRSCEYNQQYKDIRSCEYNQQYKDISEIPKDISKLTVSQIANCLALLNMSELIPQFQKKLVDGAVLVALEPKDLVDEFEIRPLTAKQLCLFAQNNWRPSK